MSSNQMVLVTACKNEGRYIGDCISGVLRQSILPKKWIIVDDGSSDDTGDIIAQFANEHCFIELVVLPQNAVRSFGSQYRAINFAVERLAKEGFDYIGFLDADIALKGTEYWSNLLPVLQNRPKVGIVGGYLIDMTPHGEENSRFNSPDTVPGGIQLFRRSCFQAVGGYVPLEYGGSDTLAEIRAKRLGWSSVAIGESQAVHFRPASSAGGTFSGAVRYGRMDASFGSDLLFETLKCLRRIAEPPMRIGGLIRLIAFVFYCVKMERTSIPTEDRLYLRRLQRGRIFRSAKRTS